MESFKKPLVVICAVGALAFALPAAALAVDGTDGNTGVQVESQDNQVGQQGDVQNDQLGVQVESQENQLGEQGTANDGAHEDGPR